jgi:hypothetical protein
MDDHLKLMKEGYDVPKIPGTTFNNRVLPEPRRCTMYPMPRTTRPALYENRIFPFDINMLRNHVFVGAIVDIKLRFHELPLPGDPASTNFMNMKLRFVNIKLRFHRSLCPRRAWGFIKKRICGVKKIW